MFRKRKPEEMNRTEVPTAGVPLNHSDTQAASSNFSHASSTPTPLDHHIPEDEQLQMTESPTQERPPTSHEGTQMHRVATRSDSVSGATFSRFSAAEDDLIIDKMQLVMKWGGEPTHSARYQSQELGMNMRDDLKLLNKEVLNNVRVFTSSEKRVKTSAQIWAASFLGREDLAESEIKVRKDLLDDSNAAKDVMDKVKKKLKHLLREGNSAPENFVRTPKSKIFDFNLFYAGELSRRTLHACVLDSYDILSTRASTNAGRGSVVLSLLLTICVLS